MKNQSSPTPNHFPHCWKIRNFCQLKVSGYLMQWPQVRAFIHLTDNQAHLTTGWRDSGNHPACGEWQHNGMFNKHSQLHWSQTLISQKLRSSHIIPVDVKNKGWIMYSCHMGECDWCTCTKHTGRCPSLAGAQGSSFLGCKGFFENFCFSTCLWHYSLFKSITCHLIV